LRRPPTSTPFPYTTLFRSQCDERQAPTPRLGADAHRSLVAAQHGHAEIEEGHVGPLGGGNLQRLGPVRRLEHLVAFALQQQGERSEEHTSELQSRENLVCR